MKKKAGHAKFRRVNGGGRGLRGWVIVFKTNSDKGGGGKKLRNFFRHHKCIVPNLESEEGNW